MFRDFCRRSLRGGGLVLTILTLVPFATTGTVAAAGSVQAQLAEVRAATARYHDLGAALADGYIPVSPCVEEAGLGGMGYHFLNPALLDGVIDPLQPELLVYAPKPNGALRLVAVEYMLIDADQDLATDVDRPTLFGATFDGPMTGHGPGQPVHYDLHAWIWEPNPAGMLAPWNARVDCP